MKRSTTGKRKDVVAGLIRSVVAAKAGRGVEKPFTELADELLVDGFSDKNNPVSESHLREAAKGTNRALLRLAPERLSRIYEQEAKKAFASALTPNESGQYDDAASVRLSELMNDFLKIEPRVEVTKALIEEEIAPVLVAGEKGVRTARGHANLVCDQNQFLALAQLRDLLRAKADEIDAELRRRDPKLAHRMRVEAWFADELPKLAAKREVAIAKAIHAIPTP